MEDIMIVDEMCRGQLIGKDFKEPSVSIVLSRVYRFECDAETEGEDEETTRFSLSDASAG